jgi:HEAT repeat protein
MDAEVSRIVIVFLACGLAIPACRRSEPMAPSETKPPATAKQNAFAPISNGVTETARPDTPTPNTPAPTPQLAQPHSPKLAVSQAIRDFAARRLESDGAGGWRSNEKAATELDKAQAQSASQLLALFKDSSAEVRRGVSFHLLATFDPTSREQVSAFSTLLDDPDPTVRTFGLTAARQMQREDQVAALPRLMALLDPQREQKSENRAVAARLSGGLRTDASAAAGALIATAHADPDANVRSAALVAVSQTAAPHEAAGAFAKALDDKEASVRLVAAARLRQLGSTAAPAAQALAAALADADVRVREAAAEALILIGEPAVHPLATQLASSNVEARKFALACLAKIGPAAKSAVPAIQECQSDTDESVRKLAEAALKRIGEN